MTPAEKLKELGITLGEAAAPAAAYQPYAITGNLIYLSGHIARKNMCTWQGKLGETLDTQEGQKAARNVAIDLISTLNSALNGDLNRVKKIIKVNSLVNSTPDFTEQHLVTNGCSEFLVEIFGEKGKHARMAFGAAQLPLGTCVEIELIAEIEN